MRKPLRIFLVFSFVLLLVVAIIATTFYLSGQNNIAPDDTAAAAITCTNFTEEFNGSSLNNNLWAQAVTQNTVTLSGGTLNVSMPAANNRFATVTNHINLINGDFDAEVTITKLIAETTIKNSGYVGVQLVDTASNHIQARLVSDPSNTANPIHFQVFMNPRAMVQTQNFLNYELPIKSASTKQAFNSFLAIKISRRAGRVEVNYAIDNFNYPATPANVFTGVFNPVSLQLVTDSFPNNSTITTFPKVESQTSSIKLTCINANRVANYCGDYKCQANEAAEKYIGNNTTRICSRDDIKTGTTPGGSAITNWNGQCGYCGDQVVQTGFGNEECDYGAINGKPNVSCSSACKFDFTKSTLTQACSTFQANEFTKPSRFVTKYFENYSANVKFSNGELIYTYPQFASKIPVKISTHVYRNAAVTGNFTMQTKQRYIGKRYLETLTSGLILNDGTNYITLGKVMENNVEKIRAYVRFNKQDAYTKDIQINPTDSIFLKITRTGNTYSFKFSTDGINYQVLGSYTATMGNLYGGTYIYTNRLNIANESRFSEFSINCSQ